MDIVTDSKFLLLCVLALVFIGVGHIFQGHIQEPLKKTLISIGYIRLDWWSVTHYLFFSILGYWYPNRFVFFLLFGIVWELTEDLLAKDSDTQLVDCEQKGRGGFVDFWCNGYQDDYWYGKIDDVLMNMLGYVTGWGIHTIMN